MTKDYGHRDILDKLGIQAGHALIFENIPSDDPLVQRALERADRPPATNDEQVDIVLALIDDTNDAASVMQHWRPRLQPTGGIWLLTYKRGKPGYIDQRKLIALGPEVGLVDNKICSVSTEISALRFVIRKKDRPPATG
jgi:Protein of unknown function (DUF3052)